MFPRRLAVSVLLALVFVAGCGEDGGSPSAEPSAEPSASHNMSEDHHNQPALPSDASVDPVVASSEIVVGENRFLIGLIGEAGEPAGSKDIDVHVAFFDLTRSDARPVTQADMRFVPIDRRRGVYLAHIRFPKPGEWGMAVTMKGDGIDSTVRGRIDVAKESPSIAVGEVAPPTHTPTRDDVNDLSKITTDRRPDPRFYEMSIADAVKADRPFVVVFGTPKYCESQTCGPMLDVVKSVAGSFPDIEFIHVEIYELEDPGLRQPVPAVQEWGLVSDPWVFVVDSSGRVSAKFEGVVTTAELRDELNSIR